MPAQFLSQIQPAFLAVVRIAALFIGRRLCSGGRRPLLAVVYPTAGLANGQNSYLQNFTINKPNVSLHLGAGLANASLYLLSSVNHCGHRRQPAHHEIARYDARYCRYCSPCDGDASRIWKFCYSSSMPCSMLRALPAAVAASCSASLKLAIRGARRSSSCCW